MPSRIKSFLQRKSRKSSAPGARSRDDGGGEPMKHPSTPPMYSEAEASTASHDDWASQDGSSSGISPRASGGPVDPPASSPPNAPATMTASQFRIHSDEEVSRKKGLAKSLFGIKRGQSSNIKSKNGVPIVTSRGADDFSPSAVSSWNNSSVNGFLSSRSKGFSAKDRPKVRPSAKASAFGGAPRYDWMDIETTAAVKVQAAWRRLRVQNRLDAEGISTPGMRNRRRRLRARHRARAGGDKYHGGCQTSEDVPFPFNLCGVGLLFGDGTLEDDAIVSGMERRRRAKKRGEIEAEDEARRRFRMRKKETMGLEEGVEVIESFEEGSEDGVSRQ